MDFQVDEPGGIEEIDKPEERVLLDVPRIWRRPGPIAVWCRDEQHSARLENALYLKQKRSILNHVLDRLEADYRIERSSLSNGSRGSLATTKSAWGAVTRAASIAAGS